MAEVENFKDGAVGRLRLNRPKAIHALNLNMVELMIATLKQWHDDPGVAAIMIDHAEGRGFCAGGDVVTIASNAAVEGAAGEAFFRGEYWLNHLMFTYGKPGVAFMDGIVMGGGVGIACPWPYRVATERTIFAMPETGIGLVPDVGGGRYLSRLPGRMAQYLGLTGGRLDGAECHAVGLATHYISSDRLDEVKAAICADPDSMGDILAKYAQTPPSPKIMEHLPAIDRLFASDRLEDIIAALGHDGSPWAQKQLAILTSKSPLSCKVTLRMLLISPHLNDFADEMRMEFTVVNRIFRLPDFAEGVRALLVDRDNQPKWVPDTAQDVTDQMVGAIFAPMPGGQGWQPLEHRA